LFKALDDVQITQKLLQGVVFKKVFALVVFWIWEKEIRAANRTDSPSSRFLLNGTDARHRLKVFLEIVGDLFRPVLGPVDLRSFKRILFSHSEQERSNRSYSPFRQYDTHDALKDFSGTRFRSR
jgi:hypothetical protein